MKKILHLITGLGAGLMLLALLSCTKGEQPLQTPEKQVEIKEQEQEQPQQQEEDETKDDRQDSIDNFRNHSSGAHRR